MMSSTTWNRLPTPRSPLSSITSRGNGPSRSYDERSAPVIRLSCSMEYAGWVRLLNSSCSSSASLVVDPMNGLIPGSTFTWSGLRPLARARCFTSP